MSRTPAPPPATPPVCGISAAPGREFSEPVLRCARKLILPLSLHRFPMPPSMRGRGLKGNAVRIGNSSRCCKFPGSNTASATSSGNLLPLAPKAGKALEQERVRRPARAFYGFASAENGGGYRRFFCTNVLSARHSRQTFRHSPPPSESTPQDKIYYGRMMGFCLFRPLRSSSLPAPAIRHRRGGPAVRASLLLLLALPCRAGAQHPTDTLAVDGSYDIEQLVVTARRAT